MTLLVSHFFFFLVALMVLLLVAGVFFGSLMRFCQRLNLFYLSFFLAGSVMSSCGEANFRSLVLGFSGHEESLAVVPWVFTFKAVLLEG